MNYYIKSCHALNDRPEQQNGLFRSTCVVLVMPGTARRSSRKRMLMVQMIQGKKKEVEEEEEKRDDTPIVSDCLRPFIMCCCACFTGQITTWFSPDLPGFSLFDVKLVIVCFPCTYSSMGVH